MPMRPSLAAVALFAVAAIMPAFAQNADRGKVVFEQCAACHSFDPARAETGPHLEGLFGRRVATVADFVYSPALRRADFVWTAELLDRFLAEPQAPPFRGNRMPFAGLSDPQARADLIAFLRGVSR